MTARAENSRGAAKQISHGRQGLLPNGRKPSKCCYSPPPEEGWLRRLRKRPRSEAGADGVVRIISNHPGHALLTFDGASTPPLEEGNRSGLAISSVGQQTRQPVVEVDLG